MQVTDCSEGREGDMFPVDLPSMEDTDLASASLQYLSSLESGSASRDWFQLSTTSKFAITQYNVRKLQLFDDCPESLLLALHSPDAPQQVVALYLNGRWWHLDDVLKTSRKSRDGLEMVSSTMERVLLLVLSRLVDRSFEEEQLFSNHSQSEKCKLLWTHGEASGFYSFKLKGSLCDRCISRGYELPVLDTIFVRRCSRRRGFGLLMLQDFCNTFSQEEVLGVSAPLSAAMVAVCKKFLLQHKELRDVLYEVEAPGSWTQRRNIWLNIQLGRYSKSLSGEEEVKDERSRSSQKICNSSGGKTSPDSETADTSDPHCGPPITSEESPQTKQTLKCKGQVPLDRDREEETNTRAKRPRRN